MFLKNIILNVFANQILYIRIIENFNTKDSKEILNELEKVLIRLTDLNNKD
jgi:predicted lipoprotein